MKLTLDIGGTNTRIGIISDGFKLLETEILRTEKDYIKGTGKIFNLVRSKDIRLTDVCIGIAGVSDNGVLYSSPNLKGWIQKRIKEDFEKELKCRVFLENDAALAGLGEAVYGAGKDYKIISYITVGTGVGGARIVDKMIDRKTYGFEPGHAFFRTNIKSNEDNFSLESSVSGKSIKRIYKKDPQDITDKKIWNGIIKNAAIGIGNTCYFWTPEIIVMGGSVSLSENFDIDLMKKEMEKLLLGTYPKVPEIKKSLLGDFSGLWGGIAYLQSNI